MFSKGRYARRGLRAAAVAVFLSLALSAAAEEFQTRTKKLALAAANEPVLYDIDADDHYEVIISGVEGDLAAFRLPGLEQLWHERLPGKGVTAPAIGNFDGTGEGLICVASTGGDVFFVHAGNGQVAQRFKLGKAVSVGPTVVCGAATSATQDLVVLCDEEGGIHVLEWKDGAPRTRFSVPNWVESSTGERIALGRINQPASVGDVEGDGSAEIIVGTALGKVVAFNLNDPSRRYVWHGPQGTAINTNIVAADFFGLGRDALVFGTNTGNLFAVLYDPASAQLKTAVGQLKLAGPAKGQMLAADFDGDGLPDLIASSSSAVISFAPAAGFATRGQPYGANAPPFSPVSLFTTSDHSCRALVTDAKGLLHIIEPAKCSLSKYLPVGELATGTILCGALTGGDCAEAVFLGGNSDKLVYVALSERKAAPEAIPTLAYGGQFERNGLLSTSTLALIRRGQTKFAHQIRQQLDQARSLYEAHRYRDCRQALAPLLQAIPWQAEARTLDRKAAMRQYWPLYVLGLIALAAAAGFGMRTLLRVRSYRNISDRVQKLLEIQAYPQAAALLQGMHRKDPQNLTLLRLLAKVYVLWERTDPEALATLEAAHVAFPDESEITLALARAYAAQGVENDKAFELYQIALAVMEESRGEIAYHAARVCEARGDQDQAIRFYRLAEKEGATAPDITERLVELYLATHQFSEKTLPAFEKLFATRTQDVRFLEGLCRAQAAARRVDGAARAAAANLLALQPDSVIALRQLAKCELQAGHPEKAISFAERAWQLDPDDDETALVLAFCYSACERLDEKAAQIYRRALMLEPQNPALLRCAALAQAATSGIADETSFDLLARATQANPNDRGLLRIYANEARKRGDVANALSAFERLVELGERSSAVSCSLAELYAAVGEYGAKAIPAYEEALLVDPENAAYLHALAQAYMRADCHDPQAIQVVEKALQKHPEARELGIYLTKHYLDSGRYEDALKLARWLLEHDKENEEIQKLVAQASFASNRLDEAIAQYQHLLSRRPDDPDACVNLALALANKHRTDDEAAECYAKALEISPDLPAVRFMLARHHAMAGRYGAALDQLAEIMRSGPEHHRRLLEEVRLYLAHAPDRADLGWFLVTLLIETGQLDEACEQLEALLELEPGEAKSILQAYDRVLSKDPMNAQALVGKARLLRVQGRNEAARPLLEQAYRISPQDAQVRGELRELYETLLAETDDTEVRFSLAKLLFAEGAYDKAIVLFQKTAQDFRYENESIKMLGQCFMAKGMLEFAFQEFRKLLVDDEVKELLYTLAQRYEAKGDFVGAKQVYRVLFAADMNYRDVKHKFELLAGATSDPVALDRSTLVTQLSERAQSRYELIEELGRGSMGIVYRARDNELEEMVALKILPESLSQNPDALHRFRAEARSARRLSHPNIVRIHDIGEEKGRKYISMEFIRGTDLKRHLRQRGRLSIEEAVGIILPLCNALDYAHRNGIVHRDIKPANIMLTEQGVAKLSDFGIAKALEATSETMTGAIIGTPLYMSPEQVQGQPVDQRADIYSLGIMFYEMLAGRPPFTEGDIAYQHCRVAPRPIEEIPDELNAIILKCLAKDREQRWSSAGELEQALRAWFEQWQKEKAAPPSDDRAD
jgi:tetratricopeptide (TPR) repeat protein